MLLECSKAFMPFAPTPKIDIGVFDALLKADVLPWSTALWWANAIELFINSVLDFIG